jgi:hypothetical protein
MGVGVADGRVVDAESSVVRPGSEERDASGAVEADGTEEGMWEACMPAKCSTRPDQNGTKAKMIDDQHGFIGVFEAIRRTRELTDGLIVLSPNRIPEADLALFLRSFLLPSVPSRSLPLLLLLYSALRSLILSQLDLFDDLQHLFYSRRILGGLRDGRLHRSRDGHVEEEETGTAVRTESDAGEAEEVRVEGVRWRNRGSID